MGIMYDAVPALVGNIPTDAPAVAGYINGAYAWSGADWARFPNSYKLRITVFASLNDGRVLDVELGDATPAQAPGWVKMRRASTTHPLSGPATIYCNASTWPAVQAAFAAQHVAPPDYWIADYDGVASVPPGAMAKQYQSTNQFDLSCTVGAWPNEPVFPKMEDAMAIVTTNPANGGKIVLDPATGNWKGLSEPAIYEYYINVLEIPEQPAASAEVFSHFTQTGTL